MIALPRFSISIRPANVPAIHLRVHHNFQNEPKSLHLYARNSLRREPPHGNVGGPQLAKSYRPSYPRNFQNEPICPQLHTPHASRSGCLPTRQSNILLQVEFGSLPIDEIHGYKSDELAQLHVTLFLPGR